MSQQMACCGCFSSQHNREGQEWGKKNKRQPIIRKINNENTGSMAQTTTRQTSMMNNPGVTGQIENTNIHSSSPLSTLNRMSRPYPDPLEDMNTLYQNQMMADISHLPFDDKSGQQVSPQFAQKSKLKINGLDSLRNIQNLKSQKNKDKKQDANLDQFFNMSDSKSGYGSQVFASPHLSPVPPQHSQQIMLQNSQRSYTQYQPQSSGLHHDSQNSLMQNQYQRGVSSKLPTSSLQISTTPPGINITKSFLFYCLPYEKTNKRASQSQECYDKGCCKDKDTKVSVGCGRKFLKLMIVELSHEEAQGLSRFKVQQLFNVSTNKSHICPYCPNDQKVNLILNENLIIGNTDQLDYKDVYQQSIVESHVSKAVSQRQLLQVDTSQFVSGGQYINDGDFENKIGDLSKGKSVKRLQNGGIEIQISEARVKGSNESNAQIGNVNKQKDPIYNEQPYFNKTGCSDEFSLPKSLQQIFQNGMQLPKVLCKPESQSLKNSHWKAKVLIFEGDSVDKYLQQLTVSHQRCKSLVSQLKSQKKKDKISESISGAADTQLNGLQTTNTGSVFNETNKNKISCSSVESPTSIANSQFTIKSNELAAFPSDTQFFQEYPEALHKPDSQQCIKFNEQLMRKIVVEKKKKNSKFQDCKMMGEYFKYYNQQEYIEQQ